MVTSEAGVQSVSTLDFNPSVESNLSFSSHARKLSRNLIQFSASPRTRLSGRSHRRSRKCQSRADRALNVVRDEDESDAESTFSSCHSACSLDIPHKCTHRRAPAAPTYVYIQSNTDAPGMGVPHRSTQTPWSICRAVSTAVRYLKEKIVERSVFPDLSLPHMTTELDVRRPQRTFSKLPPVPIKTPIVKVPIEGGRPRMCWRPRYCQMTVEEMEEEGGRKRAEFREELNRSRWMRKQGYVMNSNRSLQPILGAVRLQERKLKPRPMKTGEIVQYEEYSRKVVPWMTLLLILVLCVIYFVNLKYAPAEIWFRDNWRLTIYQMSSDQKCRLDARAQIWRFVTYQFLHVNLVHLLNNALVILVLGGMFEWTHGHVNFAVLFQMGVIAGALTVIVLNPNAIVIGASGGAYAMGGAHVANVVINYNTMAPALWWVRIIVGLIFVLFEALQHVDTGLSFLQTQAPISHASHYGGFGLAAVLGLSFTDNLVLDKWDKYLMPCGILLAAALLVAATIWICLNNPSTCPRLEAQAGAMLI